MFCNSLWNDNRVNFSDYICFFKFNGFYNISFCFFLISEPCETSNLTDEAFVFKSILFNSDQTKKKGLFQLEIEELLRMVKLASSDYISSLKWRRGRDVIRDGYVIGGEMNVVEKSKESIETILNRSQFKPNVIDQNT